MTTADRMMEENGLVELAGFELQEDRPWSIGTYFFDRRQGFWWLF